MASLVSTADDSVWMTEILNFNVLTLSALATVLLLGFITRFAVMMYAPVLLRKIIKSDSIEAKAIKDSDKALGTAVAAMLSYYLVGLIIEELSVADTVWRMPEQVAHFLPSVLQFIVAFALVIWAFRLVSIVEDVVGLLDSDDELDGTEKTLISAIQSVLRFIITFAGAIFIADALGFDLTSLIAGLGISGLALALAAKDTISNFFGATTVLLDRPFKVGDWIVVGSAEGEVIQISLRTTLLRTSADTIITMPNANLVNSPVENWGKRRWRRWQTQLHLDINSDPQAVDDFCSQVLEMIDSNEHTLKSESSWCRVNAISANSLDIAVNLYWDVGGGVAEREERSKLILNIMNLAKQLNLEFYDGRVRRSGDKR